MSRIYEVTTPTGARLVEATTRTQAINHCVSSDYSAEPISSSDLYAAIQAGRQVEKAVAGKKSDTPEPLQPQLPVDSLAPAPLTPTGLNQLAGSIQMPSSVAPQVSTGHLPPSGTIEGTIARELPPVVNQAVSAAQAPEGWTPPVVQVHPVLAEQKQINPDAVKAAAGAPILQRPARPALPPEAPAVA